MISASGFMQAPNSELEALRKENEQLRELATNTLPILKWYKDNYPDSIADSDSDLIDEIESLLIQKLEPAPCSPAVSPTLYSSATESDVELRIRLERERNGVL